MSDRLSRNAKLVKFFAQAYKGVPRKHLMKFIYAADVIAREFLGRPVSEFTYSHDRFGPYDPALDEAVGELVTAGLAEEKRDPWRFRDSEGAYKRLFDHHTPIAFDFDLGESVVLDYVVTNYLNMPFDEFMHDVIYESPPMKAGTKKGEPLPMEALDNKGTDRVGFRLAEVLKREEEGRAGRYIMLTKFVDELRSQAPS